MTVRFVVYSDYLCPWCFNAFVRLGMLEQEYGSEVEIEWKSYLLRPEPRRPDLDGSALEKFRRYTRSWERPGSEPDSGEFRVWATDESPPSHSMPPQRAAKAAARFGAPFFRSFQRSLFRAYFSENRDISSLEHLKACWEEAELPEESFDDVNAPELEQRVREDHREALECGSTGVPGVRLFDNPAIVVGAQPLALYRRWVDRQLSRSARPN